MRSRGETVFVHSPETRIGTGEIACWYGKTVSGATIYTYVEGNPLGNIDPRGTDSEAAALGAGLGAGGARLGAGLGALACPECAMAAAGIAMTPYVFNQPIVASNCPTTAAGGVAATEPATAAPVAASKSGVSEEDEAKCLARYEREMDECQAYGKANGFRWLRQCRANAFARYQACRGY